MKRRYEITMYIVGVLLFVGVWYLFNPIYMVCDDLEINFDSEEVSVGKCETFSRYNLLKAKKIHLNEEDINLLYNSGAGLNAKEKVE